MLHFIGVASLGAPLPAQQHVEQAARRLGGSDFSPVRSWSSPDCVFAWRMLALRPETAAAPVPVLAPDRHLALIGSGRIDARAELVAALGLPPGTWSDTQLMAEAFARRGAEGIGQLAGNFGFAAWDGDAQRLTLAKDYLGTVPLFFHYGEGFAAFGTNPAALLALGLCSRELNPAILGENLIGRSADPEATLYRDLSRVRRGATVEIDRNGCRQTIYWRPGRGPLLRLKHDRDYVEAMRALLAEVLAGHGRTVAPPGVMLSGGFDSGAIAATLAMLAPERTVFGFTNVPAAGEPERMRDMAREWAHVQALARRHPNIVATAVSDKLMTPIDPGFRDVFEDTGLPLTGLGLMARRFALADAARAAGVRTLFNGDGGNRTLTGEGPELFAYLFRTGHWRALARELRGSARYSGKPLHRILWQQAIRDIVPRRLLRAWHAARGTAAAPVTAHSFLRAGFAEASGLSASWARAPHAPERMQLRRAAEIEPLYLDIQPSHADAMTLAYNRMGLEVVAPLRDRRLVDFVLSLPPTQLRRDGVPRFLARRVLADRLPAETLAERGYFHPFADRAHWSAQWWDDAARRIADQHPADLAAAAIDFAALRACLAEGPPGDLPRHGAATDLIGSALPNTLHLSAFLRWHQRMND